MRRRARSSPSRAFMGTWMGIIPDEESPIVPSAEALGLKAVEGAVEALAVCHREVEAEGREQGVYSVLGEGGVTIAHCVEEEEGLMDSWLVDRTLLMPQRRCWNRDIEVSTNSPTPRRTKCWTARTCDIRARGDYALSKSAEL